MSLVNNGTKTRGAPPLVGAQREIFEKSIFRNTKNSLQRWHLFLIFHHPTHYRNSVTYKYRNQILRSVTISWRGEGNFYLQEHPNFTCEMAGFFPDLSPSHYRKCYLLLIWEPNLRSATIGWRVAGDFLNIALQEHPNFNSVMYFSLILRHPIISQSNLTTFIINYLNSYRIFSLGQIIH